MFSSMISMTSASIKVTDFRSIAYLKVCANRYALNKPGINEIICQNWGIGSEEAMVKKFDSQQARKNDIAYKINSI